MQQQDGHAWWRLWVGFMLCPCMCTSLLVHKQATGSEAGLNADTHCIHDGRLTHLLLAVHSPVTYTVSSVDIADRELLLHVQVDDDGGMAVVQMVRTTMVPKNIFRYEQRTCTSLRVGRTNAPQVQNSMSGVTFTAMTAYNHNMAWVNNDQQAIKEWPC